MNGILRDLFQFAIYKRNQGRITRQATFFSLVVIIAYGCYQLSTFGVGSGHLFQFGLPGLLLLMGVWISYRLVNLPRFAEFLISVELEMNKVSWPTRAELVRSAIVVMITIFTLGVMLFLYDIIWQALLHILGIM